MRNGVRVSAAFGLALGLSACGLGPTWDLDLTERPTADGVAVHGCFTARRDGALVPADLDSWSFGVYRAVRAFEVPVNPLHPRGSTRGTLRRGESFCLEALVPYWRLDVYSLGECNIQGPFPPGERDWYYPVAYVDVLSKVPDPRIWERPYPPDEGVYGVPGEPYARGQLIVIFRPGVRQEQAERVAEAEGCLVSPSLHFERTSALQIRFPPDRTIEEAARRFESRPEVESTTPNYLIHYYK